MGGNITVEEMNGKSDAEVKKMEAKVVKELKTEVKAIYDKRMKAINAKAANASQPESGSGAAAAGGGGGGAAAAGGGAAATGGENTN